MAIPMTKSASEMRLVARRPSFPAMAPAPKAPMKATRRKRKRGRGGGRGKRRSATAPLGLDGMKGLRLTSNGEDTSDDGLSVGSDLTDAVGGASSESALEIGHDHETRDDGFYITEMDQVR
jgi:hypothetical protein